MFANNIVEGGRGPLIADGGVNTRIAGNLLVPEDTSGVVLFAHGSGSGRHSPRNRFVAHELASTGLASLLLDLLEEHLFGPSG